jgi:hypothetical protein
MNHTLFIVDSSGFLRAYVPSYLIEGEEVNRQAEAEGNGEEEEEEDDALSMAELDGALNECVWERYTQGNQKSLNKDPTSLGARLGVRVPKSLTHSCVVSLAGVL